MLFIARDISPSLFFFPKVLGKLFVSFLRHFFSPLNTYARYKKWKDTDIIIGPVETTTTTEMSEKGGGEERGNDDDEGWRFASKLAPFVQNGNFRMQLEIDTRFVVLMMSSEKDFVCFDATCYHMGAPLLHADIEDVSRRAPCDAKDDEKKKSCVVVCPWHHYKIDVGLGGERVYFDAFTKERKTVARRQRTHEVKVDDDENVYIKLNKEEESYESDRYAHKQPLKSSRSSHGNIGSGYNRYAGTGERNRGRAFKSSGEAFITSSSGSGGMKKREESVLGQMVGKSMSGGDGVAPWAVSKEAKMSPPPPLPRGILKKSSFSTSRLMSTKGNRESIIEEREKEKEVFEDAEEEMVG